MRIFLPFAMGILLGLFFLIEKGISQVALLSFLLAFTLMFFENQQRIVRVIFMILTDVFLISYGILLVNSNKVQNIANHYSHFTGSGINSQLLVTVNELPVEKEKTIKFILKVNAVKVKEQFLASSGEVIAYLRKSDKVNKVKVGDDLLLQTKLVEPDPPMNPHEFDHKRSLELKHIQHICFVDSNSFEVLSDSKRISSLWYYGLKAKEYVLSVLHSSDLSPVSIAVCSALLTGYDDEIDRELLNAFSHSGTLHVLSVSGLHVGLFYFLFSFLFGFVDRKKRFPLLQFTFVTTGLWMLALITGFSAPIVRAVLMFNLFGVGKIFFTGNPKNTINLLFVSAFVMLNFDPNLILDIGFQLSYCALLGMIYFIPKFEKLWPAENRIHLLIRGSVLTSIAATISTLPFTLFYFKQFPIWFALSNLIVVPATFLIMILAFLLLFKLKFISTFINAVVYLLTEFITLFNHPEFGYLDSIDFDLKDAFFMSLFLLLISICFYRRSFRYAVLSFVLVFFWEVNSIIISYHAKNNCSVTVYQIKKNSVSAVKNKTEVIMQAIDSIHYDYHLKRHFISFNHPDVEVRDFNYVNFKRKEFLYLTGEGKTLSFQGVKPFALILSQNFQLTEELVQKLPENVLIISDGSNDRRTKINSRRICSKFGLPYHDTAKEGAYEKIF